MLARLSLAAASGVALWLAFPGVDLWPLAMVGCAGLSVALWRVRARTGFLVGLVAGVAFFAPLLSWSGVYVGKLPWLALSLLEALYVALLGLVVAVLQRERLRPVAFALAWTVAELARSTTPFGGFPWGRLAFSQADSPVLGAVALVGSPGLSLVVALIGALVPYAVQRLAASAPAAPRRLRIDPRAAVAAASALGLLLLPLLVPRPVDGPGLQVLAVQGNVPQLGLDFNAQRRAVLDNHVRGTEQAAEQVRAGTMPQPDLVLWPENASDIDPLRNPDAGTVIQRAVEAIAAPVVVGAVLTSADDRSLNAAMLYLPGRGLVDQYLKQRPVPFAEYIPYRSFFRIFSDKVDLVSRDFEAGTEVGVLPVPTAAGEVPLGVSICFEVVVDDLMQENVRHGAQLLLVPTNNATFGLTDESVQQLAVSRVRSVELNRSVVHISTVGESALITPDARMQAHSELFTPALLSGSLPLRTDLTLAVRLGPWPERVAVVTLAALLVITGVRRRRARGLGSP